MKLQVFDSVYIHFNYEAVLKILNWYKRFLLISLGVIMKQLYLKQQISPGAIITIWVGEVIWASKYIFRKMLK